MYQAILQSPIARPGLPRGRVDAIAAGLVMVASGRWCSSKVRALESGDSIGDFAWTHASPLLLMLGYRGYMGQGTVRADSHRALPGAGPRRLGHPPLHRRLGCRVPLHF